MRMNIEKAIKELNNSKKELDEKRRSNYDAEKKLKQEICKELLNICTELYNQAHPDAKGSIYDVYEWMKKVNKTEPASSPRKNYATRTEEVPSADEQ